MYRWRRSRGKEFKLLRLWRSQELNVLRRWRVNEQQEDYGKFSDFFKNRANHLVGSSLLKDLLYERIQICIAVKDRLAGIL